jgi:hypothetical protein
MKLGLNSFVIKILTGDALNPQAWVVLARKPIIVIDKGLGYYQYRLVK